ncbi:NACHT domain-containing protein [Microcoleus asticus]|uniref:NACHT domain-containing protein n=1 Tax=Microcoleus asticus IPMA8 TaxID=2563858 RepID=A0ABX2D5R5_9CYAN|nr:NACHT domain-containing NTPase [Microcoleus asticus]NQE37245.1 hypothetical protein [Microcoleus asticus IPMA8]
MTLPREFLIEMARKYALSPEQKDAFVIWFSSNKTELDIATELHITNSALTTRMSHVYKKFSINGKGPGKYGRLLNFLTAEYRKCKACDSSTSNLSEDELNDLIEEVREKCREMIQDQCGTMRSLTMSQPIDVSDLYTNVNILEKITSHRRREIDELLQDCNSENFDRFGLGRVTDKRMLGREAVEKYSKLMVLGKPGSGKTTFLKHLAIQCDRGKFQAHRLSVFITLKQFAETEGKPSLLEYITQIFYDCDVSADQIAVLFKHGKTLVLLDGLDEVKDEDNNRVIKQVRDFSDKFRTNHFVITCRIAAKDYTFEKFTEVEVADFDDKQIATFARKWFQAKESAKAEEFIQQLRENNRIRELATNPLLLTLLCLVFEESAKFPGLRSDLYEEGVDILLRRWDETRKIERELVYKNLSLQYKKDLLSQIALTTFQQGDYFFKQKQLEQYISDYIRNLPDAQNNPEALQLDSEAVLKSIEAQHGLLVERAHKIYSFSHLTFQEYFIAQKIAITCNSYIPKQQAWQILINNITDKRWREVFFLVVEMLATADCMLFFMKQAIDVLLVHDEKLQHFLYWINQKSCLIQLPFKRAAIRAFYFDLAVAPASTHSPDLDCSLNLAFKVDYNLISFHENFNTSPVDFHLDFCLCATLAHAINDCIDTDFVTPDFEFDFNLCQSLQKLEAEIPDWKDSILFDKWQAENGQLWSEKFRSLIIKYRNIGHNWLFNDSQKQLLQQYYDANKLLIDCLNSGCNVSPEVREEIEETLLLPKYEVKKWK